MTEGASLGPVRGIGKLAPSGVESAAGAVGLDGVAKETHELKARLDHPRFRTAVGVLDAATSEALSGRDLTLMRFATFDNAVR